MRKINFALIVIAPAKPAGAPDLPRTAPPATWRAPLPSLFQKLKAASLTVLQKPTFPTTLTSFALIAIRNAFHAMEHQIQIAFPVTQQLRTTTSFTNANALPNAQRRPTSLPQTSVPTVIPPVLLAHPPLPPAVTPAIPIPPTISL